MDWIVAKSDIDIINRRRKIAAEEYRRLYRSDKP
jgi:hypothetical protein